MDTASQEPISGSGDNCGYSNYGSIKENVDEDVRSNLHQDKDDSIAEISEKSSFQDYIS